MQKNYPLPSYSVEQITRAVKHQCWDCGVPAPLYMVQNDIWAAAWPEGMPARHRLSTLATKLFPNAMRRSIDTQRVLVSIDLCFGCLERRLKRSLTIDDFQMVARSGKPLTANAGVLIGYRMGLHAAKKG